MHLRIIMDDTAYTNETAPFLAIAAIGIHMFSGSKPPMSSWVFALNSFVLPAQKVDVSQAPTQGL